jgi:hypothetical protein
MRNKGQNPGMRKGAGVKQDGVTYGHCLLESTPSLSSRNLTQRLRQQRRQTQDEGRDGSLFIPFQSPI